MTDLLGRLPQNAEGPICRAPRGEQNLGSIPVASGKACGYIFPMEEFLIFPYDFL